jgi:serine/threonine protein kinase/tetratricopeptide (TPR) repeat protein
VTNPPASSDAFDDDAGNSTYPLKPSEGHGSDEASDDTTYPTILPPKRDETPEAHGNSDREARADRDSAREKLSLTQIGPYRLLEKLGEGGMGVVYRAEQAYPIQRIVALKLIKSGVNSRQVIRRFESERQALAMMDHPSIAKILDAGDADNGLPYFAMELVDGVPLSVYCNRNSLDLPKRLELFAMVCDGVQHAHQKGIIHRDLKPSNILVSQIDGKPLPRIIDFGLAKALDTTSRLSEESRFTEWGQVLGTLKYMSPEQAGLGDVDVDTRTDIYALGVILYELLTGTTPLDDKTLRGRAILKILELVRSQSPSKPSSRISEEHYSTSQHVLGEAWSARRLRSVLIGDLDWITMKALENDRARRYPTAASFAEDVRRFLTQQPVLARPPSFSYILSKTVIRHKLASAATLAIAAGLCLTLASALYGWSSAQRVATSERELAANERRGRLIAEAEKAFQAQSIPLLQSPETFSRQELEKLENTLGPLEQLDRTVAQRNRESLLATFALGSRLRLLSPGADVETLADCGEDLRLLQQKLRQEGSAELTRLSEDLQKSLSARERDWMVVIHSDEPLMSPQTWEVSAPILTSPTAPNPIIQGMRLDFSLQPADAPECRSLSWSLLEHLIDREQTDGYSFALTLPTANPEQVSFANVANEGGVLQLQVRRGAAIIRSVPIDIPPTPYWRIRTEIDAGTIRITLNDTLIQQWRDLFHMSTSKCTLRLSTDIPLEIAQVRLEVKPQPQQPTLIALADADYQAGNYSNAKEQYARTLSQEGQYKYALCLRALGDEERAVKTLESLFVAVPAATSYEAPWQLLAGLELFLIYQNREQHIQKHQLLTRLITDHQNSIGMYLPLLPQELRDRVMTHARRDVARWRMAIAGQGDVIQLRFVTNMEESLDGISNQRRRATRWRLADALRVEGSDDESAQILIQLIQAVRQDPTSETAEYVTLVADLAWLYLSSNQLDKADRLIDQTMQEILGDDRIPPPWTPLLTDRARIQIARDDWLGAEQTLQKAFEILEGDPGAIAHGPFAEMCAVAGLVQGHLDNPPRAQELWKRGLRKNWPFWDRDQRDLGLPGYHEVNYSRSTTFEFILHSLTGGSRTTDLMENTLADLRSERAPEEGFLDLASLLRPLAPIIPKLLERSFDHPRIAQEWRKEMILRTTPFKEFFTHPMIVIVYRGARILVPKSEKWDEELHQFGLNAVTTLIDLIDSGKLNHREDPRRILAFLLENDETGERWQRIREHYPTQLAGGLGLIKLMSLQSQNLTAEPIFRRLADEVRRLPDLPPIVQNEIARLEANGL